MADVDAEWNEGFSPTLIISLKDGAATTAVADLTAAVASTAGNKHQPT